MNGWCCVCAFEAGQIECIFEVQPSNIYIIEWHSHLIDIQKSSYVGIFTYGINIYLYTHRLVHHRLHISSVFVVVVQLFRQHRRKRISMSSLDFVISSLVFRWQKRPCVFCWHIRSFKTLKVSNWIYVSEAEMNFGVRWQYLYICIHIIDPDKCVSSKRHRVMLWIWLIHRYKFLFNGSNKFPAIFMLIWNSPIYSYI